MSYIFSIPIHWSLLLESFSPVFWVDRLVDEPTGSLVLVLPVLSTVFTWISLSFWMDFVPEYSSYFVFCDCWRSCWRVSNTCLILDVVVLAVCCCLVAIFPSSPKQLSLCKPRPPWFPSPFLGIACTINVILSDIRNFFQIWWTLPNWEELVKGFDGASQKRRNILNG